MNDDELFDAYRDGELSGEEALRFESRLAKDPSLRSRFQRREALGRGLQVLFREEEPSSLSLSASRSAILEGRALERQRMRRRGWLLGGATAVVLGGAGLAWGWTRSARVSAWREMLRSAFAGSQGLSFEHVSLLDPGGNVLQGLFGSDGCFALSAVGELPLPAALREQRGQGSWKAAPGTRLACGCRGQEFWLYRSRPRSLYAAERATGSAFWPTAGGDALAQCAAIRAQLMAFASDSRSKLRCEAEGGGSARILVPDGPTIAMKVLAEGLLTERMTARVIWKSVAVPSEAASPERVLGESDLPRARPWSESL